MRKFIFSIITFCISLILLLFLSELLLRFTGYQPWFYKAHANEPIMYESDPILGWKNQKGSYIYPAYVSTEKNIKVTFLSDGSRVTGEIAEGEADERDKLIIVGGSFTQGWAISDDETYPWKLQGKYPSMKVLNYGTGGYGTYQSLLVLEKIVKNSPAPAIVLYGFIGRHEDRNVALGYWLRTIQRASKRRRGENAAKVPYCTIDNQGTLIRELPASAPPIWSMSKSLATVNFFQEIYVKLKSFRRRFQKKLVTDKLLLEMNRLCKEKGIRFMVVLLQLNDKQKPHYTNFLKKNQIEAVDCLYPMTREMRVKGEGHPNSNMNTLWANCIAKAIGEGRN